MYVGPERSDITSSPWKRRSGIFFPLPKGMMGEKTGMKKIRLEVNAERGLG